MESIDLFIVTKLIMEAFDNFYPQVYPIMSKYNIKLDSQDDIADYLAFGAKYYNHVYFWRDRLKDYKRWSKYLQETVLKEMFTDIYNLFKSNGESIINRDFDDFVKLPQKREFMTFIVRGIVNDTIRIYHTDINADNICEAFSEFISSKLENTDNE